MKNFTKYAAITTAIFAFGCGSDDSNTPTGGNDEVRERCTSKCDDIVSSQRALEFLNVEQVDGGYLMTAGIIDGFVDDEVWIDIALNEETDISVLEELYPNEETGNYESPEAFEIPAFDTITIYAYGQIEGVKYEQVFTMNSEGFVIEVDETVDENNTVEDPFAGALDVEADMIIIPVDAEVPSYQSAQVDGPLGLGGTEFWQKWEGGHNPTYSYSEGSDAGRKCMYASARRFEAIMNNPPASLVELQETSNWGGRFFNWNDDYSPENARGSASGAVLWAWRTGLVKFISQTGTDGRCFLPTYSMADRFAQVALAKAANEDGEIQGAQSR